MSTCLRFYTPLSGEPVQLTTWWLLVQYTVEANFRLSPLLKYVRKVVCGFRKKSCASTGVRKPGNTYMCVTDRHDINLTVKVVLNLNTTNNQPTQILYISHHDRTGFRRYEPSSGKREIKSCL